jgi:hypothetical protein
MYVMKTNLDAELTEFAVYDDGRINKGAPLHLSCIWQAEVY